MPGCFVFPETCRARSTRFQLFIPWKTLASVALAPVPAPRIKPGPSAPRPCRPPPPVSVLLKLHSSAPGIPQPDLLARPVPRALLASRPAAPARHTESGPRHHTGRTAQPRIDKEASGTTSTSSEPGKIDSEEQPMMHGTGHGRVHPAAASSSSDVDYSGEMNQSVSDASSSPLYSFHFEKPLPVPPPHHHHHHHHPPPHQPSTGAYVVQVPKDKVFRVPPPENAGLFDHYTRRATRRRARSCSRLLCACLLAVAVTLAVLAAALSTITFLVLHPKKPAYTVQALAVSGLSTTNTSSSPGFAATVRAENPNGRIGLRYQGSRSSRVAVSYDGVLLAGGAWPELYQGPRNVTVFVARAASGGGIRLAQSVRGEMAAAERRRSVPFDVDVEVRVRLQVGKVGTWAVPVRARCAVVVDRLAADAKVVSPTSCDVKVRLLSWWK